MSEQFRSSLTIPVRDHEAEAAAAATPAVDVHGQPVLGIKVNEKTGTLSVRDGRTVERTEGTSYTPSTGPGPSEGVLAGARSPLGQKVQSFSEVKDDTVLTVNGMTVTALALSRVPGYIVRTADGRYEAAPEAGAGEPETQQADPNDAPVTEVLPDSVINALDQFDAHLGSGQATDAMVATSIARLAQGDMEGAINNVVQRTGMEPALAREYTEGIMKNARNSVIARLRDFGVPNGEDCLQHLEATLSASEKSSLAMELFAGSNQAYRRVSTAWIRHMENKLVGAELYGKR